jgi:hypothetical protein
MKRLPLWAVTTLAVSYFALWACAPMVGLPAPVPLTGDLRDEVGAAPMVVAAHSVADPPKLDAFWGGQAWYLRKLGRDGDVAFQVSGGNAELVSASALFRGRFVTRDRFAFGVQGGLGWLYADAGLFVAGGLSDRVWLYAMPQAGLRGIAPFRLPVGARLALTDQTGLSLDGGVGWPTYSTSLGPVINDREIY